MSGDVKTVPIGEKLPVGASNAFSELVDIKSPRIKDSKVKSEMKSCSDFALRGSAGL